MADPQDRAARLDAAARLLADAWTRREPLERLPDDERPASTSEAFAIQERVAALLGEAIIGWKVARNDSLGLLRGGLLGCRCLQAPARIDSALVPMLLVEGEIAFRACSALGPRTQEYGRNEIEAALVPFAAIEIVSGRFADYHNTPLLDRTADFMSNGAFIIGSGPSAWPARGLADLNVTLSINGTQTISQVGGHPAGDPLLPAIDLINEMRLGAGIGQGQMITTGTFTGMVKVQRGDRVRLQFREIGEVELALE